MRPLARFVPLLIFSTACVGVDLDEAGTEDTQGAEDTLTCEEPIPGVEARWEVSLTDFPGIIDNLPEQGSPVDLTLDCTLDSLTLEGDPTQLLQLELICPIDGQPDATATIIAEGAAPSGVAAGDILEFSFFLHSEFVPHISRFVVRDNAGPIFVAYDGAWDHSFGEIEATIEHNCPDYPSRTWGAAGFIHMTTDDDSLDLGVGESGQITSGDRSWTAFANAASVVCCEGDEVGYYVLRE